MQNMYAYYLSPFKLIGSQEISYEPYAIEGHANFVCFNFLHLVIYPDNAQ
jgi:hypothetical protein